jgi:hypothetical protein
MAKTQKRNLDNRPSFIATTALQVGRKILISAKEFEKKYKEFEVLDF